MAEQDHAANRPMIVVGTAIGIVLAAVFAWLFAIFGSLSITAGAVIVVFLLLTGWTVAGAVMYGAADEGAEAH